MRQVAIDTGASLSSADVGNRALTRARPMYRLNSPSLGGRRLNGKGHDRGTRRASDFISVSWLDKIGTARGMTVVPAWVSTEVAAAAERDAEHELFGKSVRSFQTWTDAPATQWHRWYDWNFHVEPEPPFAWVRGVGNLSRPGSITGNEAFVIPGDTMECELDMGAFGARQRPGPIFDGSWPWPMAGDYVWVVGRSIYDGGHENPDTTTRSELHPCKAVAWAMWEAFNFPDEPDHHGRFVPAVRFVFFTTRFGGYFDFSTLQPRNDQDYEFVVLLPDPPGQGAPLKVNIGHTAEFPFNTIALRPPDVMVDLDFRPFATNARQASDNRASANPPEDQRPRVEIVTVDGKHCAKITIPATHFASALDAYGVIVSLGWRDSSGQQARRVKRCEITLEKIFTKQDREWFGEEWRFHAGVNRRWFEWNWEGVGNDEDWRLDRTVTMHLSDDDVIQVATHGMQLNRLEEVFDFSNRGRTIFIHPALIEFERTVEQHAVLRGGLWVVNSVFDIPEFLVALLRLIWDPEVGPGPGDFPAVWFKHVDMRPPRTGKFGSYPEQRAVTRRYADLVGVKAAIENEPIGLIDAGFGDPANRNPIKVGELPVGRSEAIRLTARFGHLGDLTVQYPDGRSEEHKDALFEHKTKIDYFLHLTVTASAQS